MSEKSMALRSLNFLKALGKTLWLPAKKLFWGSYWAVGEGGALREGEPEAGTWKPSCRILLGEDAVCWM